MSLVQPISARLVDPAWAARVVSPLYDALPEAERRTVLARNPDSYLHVTGPVPREGAQALRRLLDLGAYGPPRPARVLVYQISDGGQEHTGVVANLAVPGFCDGRVLGHEQVHPGRVDALLRHYERVPLRSELVALFHRADPEVDELVSRVRKEPAVLSFTDAAGAEQSVWQAGAEETAALAGRLDEQVHYIADGHHRVAAAVRHWEQRGRPRSASVLCVVYPQEHVSLAAFHRRVRGPVDVAGLLDLLQPAFEVTPATGPAARPGAIGLYAAGRWHRLTPRRPRPRPGVAGLDVSLLDREVLQPLLGVREGDPRLSFLPGLQDLEPAVRACDEDGGVLLLLHPPRLEDLLSVAERGEVMSPKTTYVTPKPSTGVLLV